MQSISIGIRSFSAAVCFLLTCLASSSQTRVNDKDLENLMRNLNEDARAFRPEFSSALKKSTIRKTSQAKNADNLAVSFAKQTEGLLRNFKRTKQGDTQLSNLQSSSQQLSSIVKSYASNTRAASRWEKIQTELQQVLSAYGIQPAAALPRYGVHLLFAKGRDGIKQRRPASGEIASHSRGDG